MKNRGSIPILTNLVGVHPRIIHTKFEANLCSGLRDKFDNDNGHRVIARVTLNYKAFSNYLEYYLTFS